MCLPDANYLGTDQRPVCIHTIAWILIKIPSFAVTKSNKGKERVNFNYRLKFNYRGRSLK